MRGSSLPLVIEFLGPPGAGKSTLAERLLHRLQAGGHVCQWREAMGQSNSERRVRHYVRLLTFTIAQQQHFSAAMHLAAAVTPARLSRWRFAAKLATWPYRLSRVPRHSDVVILDQGPLQSAWCVLLDGELREEEALRAAVNDLLADERFTFAFIHVDLPSEMATDRIAARGPMAAPFHGDRQETLRLLTNHHEHFVRILQMAEAHVGAPVLRLDGSAPLEENDARIAAFVDRLLPRPRAA